MHTTSKLTCRVSQSRNSHCFPLLVICLYFLLTVNIGKAASIAYVGQTPSDALTYSSPASGQQYTGQYSTQVPLYSLGSKQGVQIQLALDYSSAVQRQIELSNRDMQASWVGLGFNLSMETIIEDNNLTTDTADDQYLFVGSEGTLMLSYASGNTYVPSNGAKWQCERIVQWAGTPINRDVTVGWRVRKEDGTVHSFGDFSSFDSNGQPVERSSTRYLFAWGTTALVGATNDEQLIPSQWDVSSIRSSDGHHQLDFTYTQDLAPLVVLNASTGQTVNSSHSYTRQSYPSRIESSDGYYVQFVLDDRLDIEQFYTDAEPSFYGTKKLASIRLGKIGDQLISQTRLTYDYLNEDGPVAKRKLLLKEVTTFDASGTQALPPTKFQYYEGATDPSRGSLSSIESTTGGVLKLHYELQDASRNFAHLNYADTNHNNWRYYPPDDERRIISDAWSRNSYISKEALDSYNHRFQVASWKGYWNFQDLPDEDYYNGSRDLFNQNFDVAASDDWVVFYKRDIDKYVIMRDQGGAWVRDTVSPSVPAKCTNDEEYLQIYAAKDFFVACRVTVPEPSRPDSVMFKSAYLYVKRGTVWNEFLVASRSDNVLLTGVQLANHVVALTVGTRSFDQAPKGAIYFGKYSHRYNLYISDYDNADNDWYSNLLWVVNADAVAYGQRGGGSPVHVQTFSNVFGGGSWTHTSVTINNTGGYSHDLRDIASMKSGFVFAVTAEEVSPPQSQMALYSNIHFAIRTATGWNTGYNQQQYTGSRLKTELRSSGGTNIALSVHVDNVPTSLSTLTVGRWNGVNFDFTLIKSKSSDQPLEPIVSEELCAGYFHFDKEIWASRLTANGQWSGGELIVSDVAPDTSSAFGQGQFFDCSRDVVVVSGKIASTNVPYRAIYRWNGEDWVAYDITNLTANAVYDPPPGPIGEISRSTSIPIAYSDRVMLTTGYVSRACFQYFNGAFFGKAQYPVLSRTEQYRYSTDPQPIIQAYKYYGGILDESVSSPRFCRAQTSLPYFANSTPEGFRISDFYNDIDDSGFVDEDLYEQIAVPDLQSAMSLGYINGGYLLDGFCYATFDSSSTDLVNTCFDSTITKYSVLQWINYGQPGEPKYLTPLCTESRTRVERIAQTSTFKYDDFNRLVCKESTNPDGLRKVDSTEYYTFYGPINIYNKPKWQMSYVEQFGQKQFLSRSYSEWTADTAQVLVRTASWPDASLELTRDTTWLDEHLFITADTGGLPPDVDTYFVEIDAPLDSVSCNWVLSLKSWQIGEYCLIRRITSEGSYTLDSIGFSGNCHASDYSHNGVSQLLPGDRLMIIVDNHDNTYCLGGGFNQVGWAKVQLWVRNWNHFEGNEVFPFRWMASRLDKGVDPYGNVTNWIGPRGDTLCSKFSPDGRKMIASIGNAIDKECLLFDAEFDFDAQGVGYDGWAKPIGSQVQFGLSDVFSGTRSLILTTDPNLSTTVAIRRTLVPSELPSHAYAVSAWYKGDVAGSLKVTAKVGSVSCSTWTVASPLLSMGDWHQLNLTFLRASCPGVTEYLVEVGATNLFEAATVNIDDIRFRPIDASMTTSTFDPITQALLSTSDDDNYPTKYGYDAFQRQTEVKNFKDDLISQVAYYFSSENHDGIYDPTDPNSVTTTTYHSGGPSVSCTFFDGSGAILQSRREASFNGLNKTVVSGFSTKDSRQRPLRVYKPYIDLIGNQGVTDFSVDYPTEANFFYNGVNAVNCEELPYSERTYLPGIKDRQGEAGLPGSSRSLASGHTTRFSSALQVYANDSVQASTVIDPDNVVMSGLNDAYGTYAYSIRPYVNAQQQSDSVITKQYVDVTLQRTRQVALLKNGATRDEVQLSETVVDDQGKVLRTQQVDAGETQYLYDQAGNVRLISSIKLNRWNQLRYFKYDKANRLVEQGLTKRWINAHDPYDRFNQTIANDPNFPASTPDTFHTVEYRWFYDSYGTGASSLKYPGHLVRVENGTGDYWKEFHYSPGTNTDTTVVKLGQTSGTTKGLIHLYNDDGSLHKLTILPKYPAQTGVRHILYRYDKAGRLKEVVNGADSLCHKYAVYFYNADGSLSRELLGVFNRTTPLPAINDTMQIVDYTYDAAGNLLSVNQPASIVPSLSGIGSANDHYGLGLVQYDSTQSTGYYNGRVWRVTNTSSLGSSLRQHQFTYIYNALGWLTDAIHGTNPSFNEEFDYDELGRRVSSRLGSTSIQYTYSATPGSSKLMRVSTMDPGEYFGYDEAGNLAKDPSRDIDTIIYDARNLITWVTAPANYPGGVPTYVTMLYDENGNRIRKHWTYNYWTDCNPPPEELSMPPGGEAVSSESATVGEDTAGTGVQSIGGGQCLQNTIGQEHYLYDGGVLVATFDKNDNVIDLFINGLGDKTATYYQNNSNALHYFMTDQVGSTRVAMRGVPASGSYPYLVTQSFNYYSYGNLLDSYGSYVTPFRFSGKEQDQHTTFDLDYFGARYYDPRFGTFTSTDAAGQFANGYCYGGNNPVSTIDPDGNFAWFILPFVSHGLGLIQRQQTGPVPIGYGSSKSRLSQFLPFITTALGLIGVPTGVPHLYDGTNLGVEIGTAAAEGMLTDLFWRGVSGEKVDASILVTGAIAGAAAGDRWDEVWPDRVELQYQKRLLAARNAALDAPFKQGPIANRVAQQYLEESAFKGGPELAANESVLEYDAFQRQAVGNFLAGAFEEAVSLPRHLFNLASDPWSSIAGLAYAVSHPAQVWQGFSSAYSASDPMTQMRISGGIAFNLGSMAIGGGMYSVGAKAPRWLRPMSFALEPAKAKAGSWARVSPVGFRFALDNAHHPFALLGKRWHLQLTLWLTRPVKLGLFDIHFPLWFK